VQTLLQVVLRAWREAERVASERPTGSREHDAALVASGRLKGLYAELVAAAKADDDAAALAVAKELPDLD
jgi:fructose-1,6-bisphosphatase/inositol monophosphatase family enzyme